jgi:hypothetical protein
MLIRYVAEAMSVIATFHVLPAEQASELVSYSMPRDVPVMRKFLWYSWNSTERRTFWDYLRSHGRESADFPLSGKVLWELETYLTDQGLPAVVGLGEPSLTASVAAASDAWPVVVFDRPAAQSAADRISAARAPTIEDIKRLEIARYEEDDPAEWLGFVVTARGRLVDWLRSIGPGELGVLAAG